MEQTNDLRVKFTGKGGDFFPLLLSNVFLTVVTCGIYSFWARVNIQRYLYENTSVAGGKLGWHATGEEQFLGFLKGLGVFVIIGLFSFLLSKIHIILSVLLYLSLIGLLPAILVASKRYLLSRTSYNNIRMRFTGRPGKYAIIFLKGFFLTVVTFGIYGPWFAVEMQKYVYNNSTIGNSNFDYNGKGDELFFILLKGMILSILTLGIYSSWFLAEIQNYDTNHTIFQEKALHGDLTGGKYFVANFLGFLLTAFTFGIYMPWYLMNTMKVSLESINLTQAPDLSLLNANFDYQANPLADGIGDAANFLDTIADFLT